MKTPAKPIPPGKNLISSIEKLGHAKRLSRYVRHQLEADPPLADELALTLDQPWSAAAMTHWLESQTAQDEDGLKRALRQLRKRVMLRLITRDLSGMANLDEVMQTATALAGVTLSFALDRLNGWMGEIHGRPLGGESRLPQELIVVGMGKLGGGELNVSSDIDLIFVYPEGGETEGPRKLENQEYFTRLGKKLINALHEHTSDGQVFRVDMRLRPFGDSGPLVCSFPMLEQYFETQGREWERYAWIKGRPLTGSAPGSRWQELEQLLRPFVYRKYLDFSAFASMRDLHAQIRKEVGRRELHDNIKLGPGGIREVEFAAQVFQLIRGGRDRPLQTRSTREALGLIGARKLLPESAVRELAAAYAFLRNLEHRLQYLDDAQTQNLPQNPADQTLIAEGMGFDSWQDFLAVLDQHRNRVTRHFEQVFAAPQGDAGTDHPLAALWRNPGGGEVIEQLGELGYYRPQDVAGRLAELQQAPRTRSMSASGRARLDTLMPALIEIAAGHPDPDTTLDRVLKLLDGILRRESYLALLVEYPQTLNQVARLASASPWVSDYLATHPILLDELLDTRTLYAMPDWRQAGAELRDQLDTAEGDQERQMDLLRHFKQAQTFRLVAKDLAGLLPLETLSDHLSWLADLILAETLRLCWGALKTRHRDAPRFAIIGYGKLGGLELGYASDLDIIFLYDDDGPGAQETYARLGMRINTWLTSYTSAGMLYETDLRLRPNGQAGLLVSPVAAFEQYQRENAWVWEHQALTRARFCAGDTDVGDAFEVIRHTVLCQSRDRDALKQEVLAMRQKMLDGHPNNTELFDLKHDRGGIVDVEFLVQYLILAHACEHRELAFNSGNIALLSSAADLGLIAADLAHKVQNAYREYRKRQHQQRLQGAEKSRIPLEEVAHHAQAVSALWQSVFGA